jgi:hypothetical protein
MKTSSLALIVIGIVIIVSLIAIQFSSSVQDFMAGNTMWNGVRDFTVRFKARNLDSLDGLSDITGKNALISIPYLEYTAEELEQIKQFIAKGNTLILMDDLGYGNSLLEYLGARASFDHNLLLDPLFCYKNAFLPRVVDFAPAIKEYGIEALAFNHATILSSVEPAQVIARSSGTSFLDLNRNGVQDRDEPAGPFAVAAELKVGQGMVALVSDPSMIINTMVDRNDNYQFIQYLLERGGQPDSILLDRSHLSKSPLDTSKINLEAARSVLANSYVLIGLVAVVFILVIRYTLRKGELFG